MTLSSLSRIFVSKKNKGAKMALNHLPELKGVIVQIVCVVEIQCVYAWALTNITSGTS